MTNTKRRLPKAECDAGKVKVELPAGEWLITAVCQPTKPGGKIKSPQPPPGPRGVVDSRDIPTPPKVNTGRDIKSYDPRLREAMCSAFDRVDLELICTDLGFRADFVRNDKLERECQRVIDECKKHGRPRMENLLYLLRLRRSEWTFPDLPPDGDPWWTEGMPLSI